MKQYFVGWAFISLNSEKGIYINILFFFQKNKDKTIFKKIKINKKTMIS